ncbi:putative ankyrin repeat protein [Acanthamoeba polyphaga mimivirus]|uniref:Ankyrin repeat protein n=1 Tax=Acanthamoeba polyphaga mimivirus Kroon TaxID=3069720 RepID=A0A0G2YB71_9VIRU|nr:putative ankyrin repeat protein [Acanthamoeba polyphaga mimivirus]AKI80331.1 putative ankyrin repeat protein [Acanthamoeba polyphaga mimivirus Kroon]
MDTQPINIITNIKNAICEDDLDSFIFLIENNPSINLFCEPDKHTFDFGLFIQPIESLFLENSTNMVNEVQHQLINNYISISLREEVVKKRSIIILKYLFDTGLPVDFGKNFAIRICCYMCLDPHHYIKETPKQDTFSLLKLLIEYGVDVNANEYLALYSAVSGKNFDKVKLLVENGANVLRVDNGNENTFYSKIDSIKYLLDNGVEINMNLSKALFLSIQNNSTECIQFYLELGADINQISPFDIFSLIKSRNINSIKLLIANGFDFTSLNELASKNNEHIIDVLINETNVDTTALLKILLAFGWRF